MQTYSAKLFVAADTNFRDRETKFKEQLKNKYVYIIPLKYICDIGKIIIPTKIDMKIRLTLETDMKELFECDKNLNTGVKSGKSSSSTNINDYNVGTPGTPEAQIVLLKAPTIQYEQLTLNKHHTKKHTNYRQDLRTLQLTFKVQTDSLTG